jgi:hypothetical protein
MPVRFTEGRRLISCNKFEKVSISAFFSGIGLCAKSPQLAPAELREAG